MWKGDTDPSILAMDSMVRHLLDISMQQEQLVQELVHGLHTITQELLNLKQLQSPSLTLPKMPNASSTTSTWTMMLRHSWGPLKALQKERAGNPGNGFISSPHSSPAKCSMPLIPSHWLKLHYPTLSPTCAASKFHHRSYRPGQEPRTQMDDLIQITWRWLQHDWLTPTEIVEWVAIDCFLQGLLGEERRAVGMKVA